VAYGYVFVCMYVYHIRVNVNVGRVTRRMNPALIHVVVNVRVCWCCVTAIKT